MVDLSKYQGTGGSSDLIPDGQLAWVAIAFRGVKNSRKTGGQYIDLEVTLDDGQPFAHRKLWPMIGDPDDARNSEKYREMGGAALSRILEVGQNASPANPAGYVLGGGAPSPDCYASLHGLRAAVKIKLTPATDGYAAKNEVGDWLSPNPAGATFKTFQRLVAGDVAGKEPKAAAPAAQASFFGGPAAPATAPLAAPAFLAAAQPPAAPQPPQAAVPAGPAGWGGQPTPGFMQPAVSSNAPVAQASPAVSTPLPATASPSNAAPIVPAAGGWAAQVGPQA